MSDFKQASKNIDTREQQECIAVLVDDPDVFRLMVVWPTYAKIDPEADKQVCQGDEFTWAWSLCGVDMRALADGMGVPIAKARLLFSKAKASRLILPDGAIAAQAKKTLNAYAQGKLAEHLRYVPKPRPPQKNLTPPDPHLQ